MSNTLDVNEHVASKIANDPAFRDAYITELLERCAHLQKLLNQVHHYMVYDTQVECIRYDEAARASIGNGGIFDEFEDGQFVARYVAAINTQGQLVAALAYHDGLPCGSFTVVE